MTQFVGHDAESIPNIDLRDQVTNTHRALHSEGISPHTENETIQKIGDLLLQSPSLDHQYDAGWVQALCGLYSEDPQEANRRFRLSRASLDAVIEQSLNPLNPVPAYDIHFKARTAKAYIAYMQDTYLGKADISRLYKRTLGLNVLVYKVHKDGGAVTGVANEIAVITLLLRDSVVNKVPGFVEPSFPWEDMQFNGRTKSNFDIRYLPADAEPRKIQVKSWLGQQDLAARVGTDDGDTLLEHWKALYDEDIGLIFGDVHLGNTPRDPIAISRALAHQDIAVNQLAVQTATANIKSELDL